MKTLTVTAARQNLGAWLKRTLKGEDIGVMIDGAVVAFRPVKIFSEDYAHHEYGAIDDELDGFAKRANADWTPTGRPGGSNPSPGN